MRPRLRRLVTGGAIVPLLVLASCGTTAGPPRPTGCQTPLCRLTDAVNTGNTAEYTQFVVSTADGSRSVTVSVNVQITPTVNSRLFG